MSDSIYTDEMIDACAKALSAAVFASEGTEPLEWSRMSEGFRNNWRREVCAVISGAMPAREDYLAHDVVIAVAREMGWPRREP